MQFSQFSSLELPQNQTLKFNKHVTVLPTVILQIFVVDLFSVISVVNGFTKIKNTSKWENYIERLRQHPWTRKI